MRPDCAADLCDALQLSSLFVYDLTFLRARVPATCGACTTPTFQGCFPVATSRSGTLDTRGCKIPPKPVNFSALQSAQKCLSVALEESVGKRAIAPLEGYTLATCGKRLAVKRCSNKLYSLFARSRPPLLFGALSRDRLNITPWYFSE